MNQEQEIQCPHGFELKIKRHLYLGILKSLSIDTIDNDPLNKRENTNAFQRGSLVIRYD